VLRDATRLAVEDLERLQLDEYSIPASQLVPVLFAAARRRRAATRPEIVILDRWNFTMTRDQAAPLLYEAWLNALGARLARSQAGAAAGDVFLPLPTLVRLVTDFQPVAARDSLVLGAFDEAVVDLSRRLGADRSQWSWGTLHLATFRHPVAAAFDLGEVPRGGDANTVNATPGGGYEQRWGASYRQILDVADWDRSVATSVPGQSGQPGSPYYDNLLPLWAEGRYFPLIYSRARVERETAHLLVLRPSP
jgi:penicillin amidase